MAEVRRHWALIAAIPLLLLALVFAVFEHGLDVKKAQAASAGNPVQTRGQSAAATRPAFSAEALQHYRHIQSLRAELALTDQDLAALGVSSTTARHIFTALKTFAVSSVDALASADTNYQLARHALQEAVRSINVGSSGNTPLASLPTLKQNVATAAGQRASVMTPLISQINGLLTSDQQAMWQAARTNGALSRIPGSASAPGAYRYAEGLTADQIHKLDLAARRGGASGLQAAAPQILSGAQTAAAQNALNNQQVSMAGIATAEASELPSPMASYPHTPRMRRAGASTQPAPSANSPQ